MHRRDNYLCIDMHIKSALYMGDCAVLKHQWRKPKAWALFSCIQMSEMPKDSHTPPHSYFFMLPHTVLNISYKKDIRNACLRAESSVDALIGRFDTYMYLSPERYIYVLNAHAHKKCWWCSHFSALGAASCRRKRTQTVWSWLGENQDESMEM